MLVLWMCTLSLQIRNELCLHSGDVLQRCVILFAMLMPLGTIWSIDAVNARFEAGTPAESAALLRRRLKSRRPDSDVANDSGMHVGNGSPLHMNGEADARDEAIAILVSPHQADVVDALPPTRTIADFTTLAYMFQICIMYVFSVYHKSGHEWTVDYTATFYALQLDFFRKPMGDFLLMMPDAWLRFFTWAVWKWEKYGPMLYFVPFATGPCRLLGAFGFAFMHFSFGLAMRLAMFTYITMAAQTAFIPPMFWDDIVFTFLRRFSAFSTPLTIVYSPRKPLYRWLACAALELGLLRGAKMVRGSDAPSAPRLAVRGPTGDEATGLDALTALARASPLLWWYGWLLRFRPVKLHARLMLWLAGAADRLLCFERASVVVETSERSGNALVAESRDFTSLVFWAWRNIFALFCILFILLWCLANVNAYRGLPAEIHWIGPTLHIGQMWSMFSPHPPKSQWHFVIKANLTDDTQGDLFPNAGLFKFETLSPLTWERPDTLVGDIGNHRWFKIYEAFIWGQGYSDVPALRLGYGRYICREWNARHTGGSRLWMFEWWIIHAFVHEDGTRTFAGKDVLWEHHCYDTKPTD
ncbi:HTTM domain-containing protein [Thecamonas trahens ATCC 50062]|uniref:HTTM domain-containing protein n=1 Tax=Thecamonas trahens ATCC 50062 TaxID=461836 RepID=A0A0L0D767_THETB|nr:HTTM domain-containing protein [Thecamonas trahens ATCC 50062]KNC48189.1 HTTM domain-containing protein [Thecamonas trahens ATCC 50062]|eukprot:XP_013758758.1 HTTM domain-containing protein [Thecamonas trahens ATCC 50062]